jgi:hypothetical protein
MENEHPSSVPVAKHPQRFLIFLVVGALLLMVILAILFLSMPKTATLTGGIQIPDEPFIGNTNWYTGIPIQLSVDTEDFPAHQIHYAFSGTAGLFMPDTASGDYPTSLTSTLNCKNNQTIRWDLMYDLSSKGTWYDKTYDKTYAKIIMYCEDHIIGYAVIRFDRIYTDEWEKLSPELAGSYQHLSQPKPLDVFHCTLVKSVIFPKVNGKYQSVSQEFVDFCMQWTVFTH